MGRIAPKAKGPTRYPDDVRASVLAWLAADDKRTAYAAGRHFDIPGDTVKRWRKEAERAAGVVVERKPGLPRTKGTPVADLPPDDRAEVVEFVRLSRRLALNVLGSCDAEVEAALSKGRPARLDRDTFGAIKQLTGSIRDILDAHPGLMREVSKAEGADTDDETARRLTEKYGLSRQAMGVTKE